jgi:dsDNA-specific endonuclease/ATPase MutS2
MTHDLLRRHPHISEFQDAAPEQGGAGATVAKFK